MTLTERVEELATVMRRVGAVRAEVTKTTIRLELGPAPLSAVQPMMKNDDQIVADLKAEQKRYESVLFAASEGFVDVDPTVE